MPVGLLHPGEMGTAIGVALRARGEAILWASAGRSRSTVERATRAGFIDVGETSELCRRSDTVISICPPHAAFDVARMAAGFEGIYLDANAVSPGTARVIGGLFKRFVDGGIVVRRRTIQTQPGFTSLARRRRHSPSVSEERQSMRESSQTNPGPLQH